MQSSQAVDNIIPNAETEEAIVMTKIAEDNEQKAKMKLVEKKKRLLTIK